MPLKLLLLAIALVSVPGATAPWTRVTLAYETWVEETFQELRREIAAGPLDGSGAEGSLINRFETQFVGFLEETRYVLPNPRADDVARALQISRDAGRAGCAEPRLPCPQAHFLLEKMPPDVAANGVWAALQDVQARLAGREWSEGRRLLAALGPRVRTLANADLREGMDGCAMDLSACITEHNEGLRDSVLRALGEPMNPPFAEAEGPRAQFDKTDLTNLRALLGSPDACLRVRAFGALDRRGALTAVDLLAQLDFRDLLSTSSGCVPRPAVLATDSIFEMAWDDLPTRERGLVAREARRRPGTFAPLSRFLRRVRGQAPFAAAERLSRDVRRPGSSGLRCPRWDDEIPGRLERVDSGGLWRSVSPGE